MKVVARISRWDLVKFNLHILPRMRANWIFIGVVSLLGFAYLTYDSKPPLTASMVIANLLIALVGGFAGMLAGTIVCLICLLAMASHKSGILGEHEYEIRSDGFFEKTHANEGLNRWGGILSVSRSTGQIYVRINSYLFHVIPRHGFASDDEFERYFELLRQRWQSATVT